MLVTMLCFLDLLSLLLLALYFSAITTPLHLLTAFVPSLASLMLWPPGMLSAAHLPSLLSPALLLLLRPLLLGFLLSCMRALLLPASLLPVPLINFVRCKVAENVNVPLEQVLSRTNIVDDGTRACV